MFGSLFSVLGWKDTASVFCPLSYNTVSSVYKSAIFVRIYVISIFGLTKQHHIHTIWGGKEANTVLQHRSVVHIKILDNFTKC